MNDLKRMTEKSRTDLIDRASVDIAIGSRQVSSGSRLLENAGEVLRRLIHDLVRFDEHISVKELQIAYMAYHQRLYDRVRLIASKLEYVATDKLTVEQVRDNAIQNAGAKVTNHLPMAQSFLIQWTIDPANAVRLSDPTLIRKSEDASKPSKALASISEVKKRIARANVRHHESKELTDDSGRTLAEINQSVFEQEQALAKDRNIANAIIKNANADIVTLELNKDSKITGSLPKAIRERINVA